MEKNLGKGFVRFSDHARRKMISREVDEKEVLMALRKPDLVSPGQGARRIFMRRYVDAVLGTGMLLRVVVEEDAAGVTVVTLYKTSKFAKHERENED